GGDDRHDDEARGSEREHPSSSTNRMGLPPGYPTNAVSLSARGRCAGTLDRQTSQNLPTRPPGRERPPSRPPAGVSPRKGAFANAGLGGGKAPTRHLVKTCRKLVPNHRDEASVEMSRTPSRRRRGGRGARWRPACAK